MVRKIISHRGIRFIINYKEVDQIEHLPKNVFADTRYLVRYDPVEKCAIVDRGAPEWYKPLAALHELICCGRQYEEYVPGLVELYADGHKLCKNHCSQIERYIIEIAGEHARDYVLARREMFKSLLDYDLCEADFREQVTKSLEMLQTRS